MERTVATQRMHTGTSNPSADSDLGGGQPFVVVITLGHGDCQEVHQLTGHGADGRGRQLTQAADPAPAALVATPPI